MTVKDLYNHQLVSVIIPFYNRTELLKDTLKSILKQKYENWECILIDDGSTPENYQDIVEFIEIDERFKIFRRPNSYTKGGNGARNFGLEKSLGEFIMWFDSDDIMLESMIQNAMNEIMPEDNMIASAYTRTNDELQPIKDFYFQIETNVFRDYILWKQNCRILTPSVLFKKKFLIENQYRFDESLTRGQETEFFGKIFIDAKNQKLKFIDTPGFLYRQHSDTKSFLFKNMVDLEKISSFVKVSLKNLNYALQLKDSEISDKSIEDILGVIFKNKFKLGNIYMDTLKELNKELGEKSKSHRKSRLINFYRFMPNSSYLNKFFIKYFQKEFINRIEQE